MHDDIQGEPKLKTHHQNPPAKPEATESFHTPEEIAAHDDGITIDMANEDLAPPAAAAPISSKPKPRKWFNKLWPPSKKQLIITGAAVVVLAGLGIAGWKLAGTTHQLSSTKPATIAKSKTKAPTPKSNTVASTLTGLQVNPSANQRPITAVMIENLPPARPQSGLSQAGVVFEALTEGGITRFMALFQDQLPTSVGPVRSLRPYFIDWALGFDAPIAHDGGSPQALADVTAWNVKDLDQMYNPGPYVRISSRPSPHNLYASLPALVNLEASKGWTSSSFTGWPRKPDAPAKTPNATNINFTLSYSTYNVNYLYNKSTNSYNRSVGGAPQIDANTNKQLSPKVVIGMVIPWSQGSLDTSNAYYSVYQTIGSGAAYVFQDGTLTIGTWSKPSANAPIAFTTANGQTLKLNAGQTWITAIAAPSDIAYN